MRLLKRLALALGGLLALFLLVGLFLPSAWSTERSIEIEAPPSTLLPLVDTPRRWMDWAPWNKGRYPKMSVTYEGPERGVGAGWSWTGEDSGNGRMTMRTSDPGRGVEFDLQFEDFNPSKGALLFRSEGDRTTVTWSMSGDNGNNPVARWFALLMDSMLQKDFEAGLTKLKALAEAEESARKAAAAAQAARAAEAQVEAETPEATANAAD